MLKKAEEWGADLRYETPFVQLAQDENGKVTGAYAKIGDGYVLFNASKGVILATGGYEANPDLLAELNPDARGHRRRVHDPGGMRGRGHQGRHLGGRHERRDSHAHDLRSRRRGA